MLDDNLLVIVSSNIDVNSIISNIDVNSIISNINVNSVISSGLKGGLELGSLILDSGMDLAQKSLPFILDRFTDIILDRFTDITVHPAIIQPDPVSVDILNNNIHNIYTTLNQIQNLTTHAQNLLHDIELALQQSNNILIPQWTHIYNMCSRYVEISRELTELYNQLWPTLNSTLSNLGPHTAYLSFSNPQSIPGLDNLNYLQVYDMYHNIAINQHNIFTNEILYNLSDVNQYMDDLWEIRREHVLNLWGGQWQ